MKDRRRLALALLFALTLALAFPFRAGELRFDFGMVAGWLALAPLAALIRDLSPRAAFTWTLAASWFGYTLVIFWLYVVVTVHGGAPMLGGIGAVAVVTGVFAVHAGAAAALSAWLSGRVGRAGVLVLPSAWLVMEHLRGFDFLGRHRFVIGTLIVLYKLQDEYFTHIANFDRSEFFQRLLGGS